jgi:hypothetical protein
MLAKGGSSTPYANRVSDKTKFTFPSSSNGENYDSRNTATPQYNKTIEILEKQMESKHTNSILAKRRQSNPSDRSPFVCNLFIS